MAKPSPIGTISFPHLWTPQPPAVGAEPRYSMIVIFDQNAQNTPEYKAMKAAAYKVAKDKWGEETDALIKKGSAGKPGGIKMPFRDATEKDGYQGFDEGKIFISPWSKKKPDVIDGRLNAVIESDLFPGCLGRVTYNAFAYDMSGNKGVSFGLNNVQVADFTTPRLDGKASGADDFDSIDSAGADQASVDDSEDMPF